MIGSPASDNAGSSGADKPGRRGGLTANRDQAAGLARPSLRERKKAKTRQAIQEQALRLFREQGYDETTVEQIADAAEVSPSTFFRYFGSKEDVVIYDALDPILIEAWHRQPRDLRPIPAMRRAMVEVFANLTPDQRDDLYERAILVYSNPDLRLGMMDDLFRTADLMASEIADRTGRSAEEFEVRAFTGALIGAIMAVLMPAIQSIGDPNAPSFEEMVDKAFAYLEAGLPL